MKKTTLLKTSILTLSLTLLGYGAVSYSSNSPGQKSGAPSANGQTCAISGCHTGGIVSNETVTITTDIPATGFAPNTEYTITLTGDNGGGTSTKAGFEVSIEDGSTPMGTLVLANSSTKLISSGSLITHNNASAISNNAVQWVFKWNSGAAPDGTKIYAAINFANSNNKPTGDVIKTNNITLSKNTIGIEEAWVNNLNVFPNPATTEVNIIADFNDVNFTRIVIFDLSGRQVKELYAGSNKNGIYQNFDISYLKSGTYLLSLISDGNVKHQKLIIH